MIRDILLRRLERRAAYYAARQLEIVADEYDLAIDVLAELVEQATRIEPAPAAARETTFT